VLKNNPPQRVRNEDLRSREDLYSSEIEKMVVAVKDNRNSERDQSLIRICASHGLRVSELIGLKWKNIDFDQKQIFITRCKSGVAMMHPLWKKDVKALKKLYALALKKGLAQPHEYIFLSERGDQISTRTARHIVREAGDKAGLKDLKVHPHMLRHFAGTTIYKKTKCLMTTRNFLGHRSITSTQRYANLDASQFNMLESIF
jgi:integrase